ncbi:MAG: transporter [Desulfurivibrio sp.]|nr:MAG: transporter [Desulfurivibrio sp.]
MKNPGTQSLLLAGSLILAFHTPVLADNDARDYIPLEPGTTLIAAYYNYISATDFYADGDKINSDTNLSANIGILRPVYYTKLGPFVIDPQMLIPFGEQSLDGDGVGGVEISSSGLADPIVTATIWLVNDPASKTWLGFTPFITVPLGEYDEDKALNMGANRWAFKPEVGFVKGFGNYFFELTGNCEFYTDNDDFSAQSLTLEQDPVYTLESHLSYNFSDAFYISGDYFYHNGGETTLAGIDQHDEKDDHAVQLTLGFLLNPSYQLLLKYKTDIEVENGLKTNTVGLRFAHFF